MATTEQKMQKPVLPQSAVYNNLKQSIIAVINQSGLPPWVLVDMITNITMGVQAAADQQLKSEMEHYEDKLKSFNEEQEKAGK